ELVPEAVWSKRYAHINHFEKLLADEGTTVLKFYLHIDKDEQKEQKPIKQMVHLVTFIEVQNRSPGRRRKQKELLR
ncbi:MAG TPA: hypothetical protein PK881_15595, partial [Leptospiraceae bacterium]|nr:hypothetical protein [Leptospiraceae bacterium]